MSETAHQPTESTSGTPGVTRANRKGWQMGLRTMALLIAAIAVWIAYFSNRNRVASLETQIRAMQRLAHELIISDASKIAVVKTEELWSDDNRWEIHLPDGRYRLCVATREIDKEGLAPVAKCEPLGAGRHRLALEQDTSDAVRRVTVTREGTPMLAVEEPKPSNPVWGSRGGGRYSQNTQLAADQPLVLFRLRFMLRDAKGQMTTPSGPAEGILLWVERTEAPNTRP